jgi:TonB family protein
MSLATPLAILLFCAPALAQNDAHAQRLLDNAVAAAKAAINWSAEGSTVGVRTVNGSQIRDASNFKIAVQGRGGHWKERYEITELTTKDGLRCCGSENLQVCDGTDSWSYYPQKGWFNRDARGCGIPLAEFAELEERPTGASVIGRDVVQLAEGARQCEVIRAQWGTGPGVRTMCIDAARHLLLRDTFADSAGTTTTTYARIEIHPKLSKALFEFSLPTGSYEMQDQLFSDHSYPPRLTSKIDPSYTEDARHSAVSGIVLVSLTVGPDGRPGGIRIVHGLGHGLDERAIEAVGKWQFAAGTKDGTPVAAGPLTFVVNFQLQPMSVR